MRRLFLGVIVFMLLTFVSCVSSEGVRSNGITRDDTCGHCHPAYR